MDRMRYRLIALTIAVAVPGVAIAQNHQHSAQAAPAPTNASVFTPMQPQRLVDSRVGVGMPLGRLAASTSVDIEVAGLRGIPVTATAVMANVTAVDAGGQGYLQVFPTGRAVIGSSSTLNVDNAGQTIPNASFASLGDGGKITVYTTFDTDLVIDISGYFTPSSASKAGRLVPLTPTRILDSRIALGWTPPTTTTTTTTAPTTTAPPTTSAPTTSTTTPGIPPNPGDTKNCSDFATYQEAKSWFDYYYPYYGDVAHLDADNDLKPCESLPGAPNSSSSLARTEIVAARTVITLQVAGRGGVPSSGVSAVAMNVTAVDPAGAGYVQVAPTPVNTGASSNLNTAAGLTIANLVVVPLGPGGRVDLYTSIDLELVADVVGYFTDSTAENSSAGLFVPVAPNRQLDTREPAPQPVLALQTTTRIDISDIANGAIAIAGNLTATEAARFGWVQLAATPVQPGASSNLNIAYDGQTIANAVVSPVAGGLLDAYNSAPAHVLLDVTGWFSDGSKVAESVFAASVLAGLTVEAEYTGPVAYDRDLFEHWILSARGCTTREEVLIRDSLTGTVSACTVSGGTWYSPYDGATWTNPADVDIDHVVALSEAWDSGAHAWDAARRRNFANDLTDRRTLIAVTDNVNASKSDSDPAGWLPPNTADTCGYIGDWIAIKARWSLSIDSTESTTLRDLLGGACEGLTIAPTQATP